MNLQEHLQRIDHNLLGFALKLTGNNTDADDLYQDTLVRIYLNFDRFEPDSNFKAWAITIMRNVFINNYRKKVRRRAIVSYQPSKFLINKNNQTFNMGEDNLACEDLHEMVDALPKNFKTPFMMVFQGYKYDEIADIMDLPLGTVKSRVFFARKKLMRMCNATYLNRA